MPYMILTLLSVLEGVERGRGAEVRELDGRPRNVRDTHRRVHTPPRRKGDARLLAFKSTRTMICANGAKC